MKIAICDDIELYRNSVKDFCQKYFGSEIKEIACFSTGNELLSVEQEFDLLFLDIEMPEIDGIAVKNHYELTKKETLIVFLTSHKERVMEAFGKNVFAFLDKPIKWDMFVKTMERVRLHFRPKTIDIESCGNMYTFIFEEIRYIEARDKYTYVVTEKGETLVRKSMKEWETLLGTEAFCRVNRSYLVSFRLFYGKSNEIILKEGKSIMLSRKNRKHVFEQYKEYLRKKVEELQC